MYTIGTAGHVDHGKSALVQALTGINPDRIIRIVWVMSAGFAGLAGMLLAISFGSFNWSLGMLLLLLMFAAVTLGGLGTAFGALLGSLVILILVLLLRPQGLLGRAERIG